MMDDVKYVLQYNCEIDDYAGWEDFRTFDNLEDAITTLGIEARRHTALEHRLVKVETTTTELLTINSQERGQ